MFAEYVGVIGTAAAVATAVVAALIYRHIISYSLPVVSVKARRQADDLPHLITFELDQDSTRWQVAGARARGANRLALDAEVVAQDISGQVTAWGATDDWRRRVRFDPPSDRGIVLVHPDTPERFSILFTVSLRARPRVRRRIPVRLAL